MTLSTQLEVEIERPHDKLAVFYREYAAGLRTTAARILGSVFDAEDVLQEAFLRLHRAEGVADSVVGSWLRTTVVRLSLMRLRSRYRRRQREDLSQWEYLPSAQTPDDGINALVLDHAIQGLPDSLRVIFVLHHVEGYTHTEISALLSITALASRKRLSRATRLLRKELGDE